MLRSVLVGIRARNFIGGETGIVRRAHQPSGNHLFVGFQDPNNAKSVVVSWEVETDLEKNTVVLDIPRPPEEIVAFAKVEILRLVNAGPRFVDGNTRRKSTELLTATSTRSGVSGWGSFLCDQVVERDGWKIRFPFSLPPSA